MIHAFVQVAALAHVQLDPAHVEHELLPAPHKPPSSLPPGLQAVYAFLLDDLCLKVGKAGPKTQARFTSQHYGFGAPSTLAKSILANPQRLADLLPPERRTELATLNEAKVGAWIEHNAARLHIFLPTAAGPFALGLLEAFVQCRLNPLFEGKQPASSGGRFEAPRLLVASTAHDEERSDPPP
jgi:hypothetical protein